MSSVTRAYPRVCLAQNRRADACRLHDRTQLLARAGAGAHALQGAQRLEARSAERRGRAWRLVESLQGPRARSALAANRGFQPDRRRGGGRLRTGARDRSRGSGRVVSRGNGRLHRDPHPDRAPGDRRQHECGDGQQPARPGRDLLDDLHRADQRHLGFRRLGALDAGRSKPIRRARRRAPPISTMPSSRRRRSSPLPISICARRIP